MSLRTSLLGVLDTLRGITGPSGLDLRTSQLTIRTRTYTGGRRTSTAVTTDSDVALPQIYKVRQVTTGEIANSGGRYEDGDIMVGPITPSNGAGVGYTEAQLAPKPSGDGVDVLYLLSGAHAGTYDRVELRSTEPFSYYLVLRRTRITP